MRALPTLEEIREAREKLKPRRVLLCRNLTALLSDSMMGDSWGLLCPLAVVGAAEGVGTSGLQRWCVLTFGYRSVAGFVAGFDGSALSADCDPAAYAHGQAVAKALLPPEEARRG